MARLNQRPSYASTSGAASRSTPQYAVDTPRPSEDQENYDPSTRSVDKGKGRASDLPPPRTTLPSPGRSDSIDGARGQKRKRAGMQRSAGDLHEDDDEDEDNDERNEKHFNRHFDPNQNPEERRQIKKKSRALEREFQESRDDLLRDSGKGLTNTIHKANEIYKGVKQTNDATLDSRLLVNVSDLAYKKSVQLVLGDTSTGVDVDEFLSKCITYMRNGGPLEQDEDEGAPSTSRRRQPRRGEDSADEEDDDDIIGAPLDWAFLGRHACFPYNSRPCVPTFLLGPLSVEKKQRKETQRRARQAKDTTGQEARPEALTRNDLHQSDENGLTAICSRINAHLKQHVKRAEATLVNADFTSREQLNSERGRAMLKKCRVSDTGGPSLFDFAVNPWSFGQTIENLFYVSFLIKEGSFGIFEDGDGMPTIMPSQPSTLEEQRKNKSTKQQAVFSLDYKTWERLIEAFDIREPLIAHREENESAAAVGQRGWYA